MVIFPSSYIIYLLNYKLRVRWHWVSVLDCQSRGLKFQSGKKFVLRFLIHSDLSYDKYTNCTLTVGRWDSEGESCSPAFICRG